MSHNTCGLNVILKAESKDRKVFPLSAKKGTRSCNGSIAPIRNLSGIMNMLLNRNTEVGKNHWRFPSPSSYSEQGQLEQSAQYCVQSYLSNCRDRDSTNSLGSMF